MMVAALPLLVGYLRAWVPESSRPSPA
jgi:hypothetical protein